MRRPRRAARASGAAARGCSSLRVVIRGLLVLPGRLGPWEASCRGLLAGHASHACGSPGAARKTACPDPFHRFGLRPLPVGLRRAGRRPLHSMMLTFCFVVVVVVDLFLRRAQYQQQQQQQQLLCGRNFCCFPLQVGTRCPRFAPVRRASSPGRECCLRRAPRAPPRPRPRRPQWHGRRWGARSLVIADRARAMWTSP